jgi:hypothetical protein
MSNAFVAFVGALMGAGGSNERYHLSRGAGRRRISCPFFFRSALTIL